MNTPECDAFASRPMPYIPGKAPSQICAIGWESKARELEARLTKAETALTGSGWTLKEGAEAWKPPVNTVVGELRQKVCTQEQEIKQDREALRWYKDALERALDCVKNPECCWVCIPEDSEMPADIARTACFICEQAKDYGHDQDCPLFGEIPKEALLHALEKLVTQKPWPPLKRDFAAIIQAHL